MCRLIVFTGTCTCCGGSCTWEDLSQELSCLEAKNAGVFGECRRGIQKEEHTFDQECEECVAEAEADEGYGELEEEREEVGGRRGDKGKQKAGILGPTGAKNSSDGDTVDGDGRRSKKQRTS